MNLKKKSDNRICSVIIKYADQVLSTDIFVPFPSAWTDHNVIPGLPGYVLRLQKTGAWYFVSGFKFELYNAKEALKISAKPEYVLCDYECLIIINCFCMILIYCELYHLYHSASER